MRRKISLEKSTTYTMLKRLCNRKSLKTGKAPSEPSWSKEDVQAIQGEEFLKETFDGSLPQFLAAFTRRNKLSEEEIRELESLIEGYKEG